MQKKNKKNKNKKFKDLKKNLNLEVFSIGCRKGLKQLFPLAYLALDGDEIDVMKLGYIDTRDIDYKMDIEPWKE